MQTTSNVATIRALYESLASSADAFVSELNEVTFRLLNSDLWEGCTDEVLFPASTDGWLVLPREFVAVLGFNFNCVTRPIWDQFHEYQPIGIGWQNVETMAWQGLIDAGMVVAQKEISEAATLRVKPTLAVDAGKTIRFFGQDQNLQPIYTQPSGVPGIDLTTAVPFSDTTQQFKILTGIQCQSEMKGRWTLWQVVNGQETQIGVYEAGDSIPQFRRYKIGLRTEQDVIRCFCRRQWVRAVAETDWIFPGCLSAIKMGFKALQLEDANQYEGDKPNADAQWERAFNELDKELSVLRGGALPSIKLIGGPYPRWPVIVN